MSTASADAEAAAEEDEEDEALAADERIAAEDEEEDEDDCGGPAGAIDGIGGWRSPPPQVARETKVVAPLPSIFRPQAAHSPVRALAHPPRMPAKHCNPCSRPNPGTRHINSPRPCL